MGRECIFFLNNERQALEKVIDFWIEDNIFGFTDVKDHFG